MHHFFAHGGHVHGGLGAGLLLVGVLILVAALLGSIGRNEA